MPRASIKYPTAGSGAGLGAGLGKGFGAAVMVAVSAARSIQKDIERIVFEFQRYWTNGKQERIMKGCTEC